VNCKIIRLRYCYPIVFSWSFAHWERNATQHGKISNPILASAQILTITLNNPSSMKRLWLYFRGGYAFVVDVTIDRRDPPV